MPAFKCIAIAVIILNYNVLFIIDYYLIGCRLELEISSYAGLSRNRHNILKFENILKVWFTCIVLDIDPRKYVIFDKPTMTAFLF